MYKRFGVEKTMIVPSHKQLPMDMPICQSDYPLDFYSEEFLPYAEEYQALPDRTLATILPWMESYILPASAHFGDSLLLLAHYYMGGEIVKLVERFGGEVGDSYQLALKAIEHPEKKIIVESAVHFMAESISILANDDQRVYITNPKSGCTMEMHAKEYMVEPAVTQLHARYGRDNIIPICYMNTSARIKALVGSGGGAVCTSSNVKKIFEWALKHNKKILFIPDRHMGENAARWVGIPRDKIAYWPGGIMGSQFQLEMNQPRVFDEAQLILFCSECTVHAHYSPAMIEYWKSLGYHTVVHPECRYETVLAADSCGSTAFIFNQVLFDKAGTQKYAVGTENHMVQNLKVLGAQKGITVVNAGEAVIEGLSARGCGCATMSRNDPPHLVALLDLLRKNKSVEKNEVKAGDIVDEFSGVRTRLDVAGQQWTRHNARLALEKMIDITES